MSKTLFKRKTLDQICTVPDKITDVYVVEHHIWADGGSSDAKKKRQTELNTLREFLIAPVRALLYDVLKRLAAPYDPSNKDNPVGQGWWIQAEFGSGKSHLLSSIGAMALGNEDAWEIIREKEAEAGKGKRESIYQFYEDGIAKKSSGKSRGIFVVVKTLVGQGSGTVGVTDTGRTMTQYILDAVHEQYYTENGKSISLYPVEMLADRFLNTRDFELYRKELAAFLKDPRFFDEEEQEDLDTFVKGLREGTPAERRDCGNRLWRFYDEHLNMKPNMPDETEAVLENMVKTIVAEGYAGVLLILDEVSLFMKSRTPEQRDDDEKTLVVLSNRIAKHACLPLWTICSAQQAIESKMGQKNIIADERLKFAGLLRDERNYYDIVLTRVRKITDPSAIDAYFEDYKRGFTWPDSEGPTKFAQYFPFYPPAIDVLRALSYHLTTARSSIHFMHQTLKGQRKAQSNELISLWQMFDDVVSYTEDPSGTTAGIAAISSKFNNEWRAYEVGRKTIGQATKGHLKVYASRCEKILKTLFLYSVAKLDVGGLSVEQIMNCVMEWKDHKAQDSDSTDNLDHYEALCEKLAQELPQVRKAGKNYVFNPIGGGVDVKELFEKARTEAEGNEVKQRQAWEALLDLEKWEIHTSLMRMDLAYETTSIFRDIAPAEDAEYQVEWHGRVVKGKVYMRDLADVASKQTPLPPINSAMTDQDFAVFISNRPCGDKVAEIAARLKEPRALYWTPDDLTAAERDRLIDFAAYRQLVGDYRNKDTAEAKDVLTWVADRLKGDIGTIYKIVPDSFGRGRICARDHGNLKFACHGELGAILSPLVGQVLDAVYESARIQFSAPAPFTDNEAIKVITGIVCPGEIPKGAKPTQYISAAENYGYDLGIMKKTGQKKLDPSGCEFVEDIEGWLNETFEQGNTPTVESVYKNFTGTDGPGGKHYGLSRRMIDVYLLSLVKLGKIRVTLSGKAASIGPHLDLANLADVQVNAALLGGMNQIQRLKAPEGWTVLAPYAAVLIGEPELVSLQKDADIQQALKRIEAFRAEKKPGVESVAKRLDDLCADIEQTNPAADCLGGWKTFFEADIDPEEPIPHLLHALDKAFGYRTYEDNEMKQAEVDDLATRRIAWERAGALCEHEAEIRAAHRYSKLQPSGQSVLADLHDKLKSLRKRLGKLEDLLESTAKLQSQVLDPLGDIRDTYKTRFLQAFDQVTGKCEAVRAAVEQLPSGAEFQALALLEKIDALSGIDTRALRGQLEHAADGLFATELDRNRVERALRDRPIPEGCSLQVDEAEQHIEQAETAERQAIALVRGVLVAAAKLLQQPALRSLLEQGKAEAFIAEILAAADPETLAIVLASRLSASPDCAKLLAKYLKRIQVKPVRLSDFHPSQSTIEQGNIEQVVTEFREFLESAFAQDGQKQSVVVEFKE